MEFLEEIEYVGDIPEGWKWVKLGEIADVRDGTHDSPKKVIDGKYLITSKHIKNGKIDFSKAYKISLDDFEAINKRSKVDKYDILFSMIGTIGEMVIVDFEPDFAIKNVGLFKTGNKDLSKWIYYYLKSNEAQAEIRASLKGSTQQYITLGDLRNFPILLPPPPERKAIAEVLSSIDDKIELLHRQNKTLEEMAMTLFRQWFIEPTKDGLPDGWEEKRLKDVYIFEKGIEPGSKNYLKTPGIDTVRFIRVGNMLDNKADVYVKKDLARNSICNFDDLLVSFDGTVGRVSFGLVGCYSSGIRKIYSKDEIYNKLWLKHQIFISEEIQDEINMHAEGTTILHASSSIDYLSFVFPPKEKIEEYDKFFDPIYKKILHNKAQIQTL
ncbi:type I restriction/modification specificity protein, partial [Sulfurihydrogenibium yellowstonense SS-5]